MPRPKSKDQLIALSHSNYNRLFDLIDSFGDHAVEREFPEGTMNRNIRDVLAHLHAWHLMMLQWYEVGMNGEKPDMPAKGYTWKTTSDLNRKIWNDCQGTSFKKTKELLDDSHSQVNRIIEQHTNEELFQKKRYKWTGSTSLGAYLISSTSSHYDWAFKLIKRSMK
ncbi:MAG: ClbS/DfsB family four-helix bundle protein [Bacteroidota bacterium]